jgi:O-antigen ligase
MGQIPWFVFANQAPLTAQAGGFAIFLFSLGGMLATAHLIKELKWLKIIIWVFIGLGELYMFGRLLHLPIDRIYNWAFVAGSMFWTWLVTLAFAQAFFNTNLTKSVRVLLYGVVLNTLFVAYVWGNEWKSGWVPPLVAIVIMVGLKYKRLVILSVPFALTIVVYLAFKLIFEDAYSWGTRVDAWQIIFEISKVSPLFGMGFANYYWYTPLSPIRGYAVSFNSHSQYIDLIAQVGILGLLSFLWVFFEVGRLSWNLSHSGLADGFAKAYARGIFAGVIATLMGAFLGDWVLPFVYNVGFHGFRASILPWIFFGGLLAIEQMVHEKAKLS